MIFDINGKKNSYVVFIHGFMNTGNTWNYGKNETPINIEKKLRKKYTTINITFTNQDYKKTFEECSIEIYNFLEKMNISKMILITHSIGSIYAKILIDKYDIVETSIFIDPSEININFLEELTTEFNDINTSPEKKEIFKIMIDNFPKLNYYKKDRTNIYVLFNIKEINKKGKYIITDMTNFDNSYWNNYINTYGTDKYKIILYYNLSHMIHHKRHEDILYILH